MHLIINNQIGFTTDPDDARSTRWASDLAKGFDVPIIHVNADDVEACISAVRLAFAFRQEFGHDVLIDLIGYRRFGHNESDEPAYTQPEMYAKIKDKKRVCGAVGRRPGRRRRRHPGGGRTPGAGGLGRPDAAAPAAEGADRRGRRARRRATAPASTSSTARLAPRSTPPSRPSGCASSTRSCCACPTASRSTPSSSASSNAAARRSRRRSDAEIDWAHAEALAFALAARRGHADPPDRPGHRARHVQPAPPGPARRQQRPDRLPDPEPAGRAGAVRAAQQPAVGARLPGLRVRLQPGVAGDARAVGGAVRRLRQRAPR